MLRVSKLADYGTYILAAMVREPERVQSATGLAERIRLPQPTVSKILKMLARQGLLLSVRGARGGYLLARPASEISLAQVLNAMEGPPALTECSVAPGLCPQEAICRVRRNWLSINTVVLRTLEQVTLAQMAFPDQTDRQAARKT